MKLKIKNIDLEKVILFLEQTSFKGIASVNRSKVTNYLSQKIKEVSEGEMVIRNDYADDAEKRVEELDSYFFENFVVVSGDEFVKPLNVIKTKIKELTAEDSQEEFSGESAFVLAILYEEFKLGDEAE